MPFVAVFRNGRRVDGVDGQNETGTSLLLRRVAAQSPAAAKATAPGSPPAPSVAPNSATEAAAGARQDTRPGASPAPAAAGASKAGSSKAATIASLALTPSTVRQLYGGILQLRPQAQDAGHKALAAVGGLA